MRFDINIHVSHRHIHVVSDEKRLRIGRLAIDNDVVLDGDSVSRCHAQMVFDNRGFGIRDSDSLIGTLLNGRQIDRREPLEDGDTVIIGAFRMEVDLSDPTVLRARVERDPKLSLRRISREYRRIYRQEGLWMALLRNGGAGLALAVVGLAVALFLGGWPALAPGEVMPGHVQAEQGPRECEDCHASKVPIEEKCLECHDDGPVRHDLVAEASVSAMSCPSCHFEHRRVDGLWTAGVRPDGCTAGLCHETHQKLKLHPVAERYQGAFAPPFSHADHPNTAEDLDCGTCHTLGAEPIQPRPGSYEGCISCHNHWRVFEHSYSAYCRPCHTDEATYPSKEEEPYTHEISTMCLRCHRVDELYAEELPTKARPSSVKFKHNGPEHRTACDACHPDVAKAVTVIDVRTEPPDSPACERCHKRPADYGACPDCHLFHD